MDMSTWSYVKDGQKQGPVEAEQIKQLIASKALPPTALVWKNGMANWVAANTLPEFSTSTPAGGAPPIPGEEVELTGEADVEANKVMAILAYLWLLFVVPLLVARQSKYAMYHTNQGIILFIAWMILVFGWLVVGGITGAIAVVIPFLGSILGGLVSLIFSVGGLGCFILWILGIINAAQGLTKPLPLIGHYTIVK
jgi:uncharacterized membrane protein